MKTEIGLMYLQDTEPQRLPAKHQQLGERHGTDSPSQPQELATLQTLDVGLLASTFVGRLISVA